MEASDFTATVACFMRLSWAAAAGRLDLVGSSQPIKESNSLFPAGIRSRLSSSGSNCSSSSEGEPAALHAGICVRQQSVSTKDALIAGEALSLLVTCLQLRSQQLGRRRLIRNSFLPEKSQVSVKNWHCFIESKDVEQVKTVLEWLIVQECWSVC